MLSLVKSATLKTHSKIILIHLIFCSVFIDASLKPELHEAAKQDAKNDVQRMYAFYHGKFVVYPMKFIQTACLKFMQEQAAERLKNEFLEDEKENSTNSNLAQKIKEMCTELDRLYFQHEHWKKYVDADFREVALEVLSVIKPIQLLISYQEDKLQKTDLFVLNSAFVKTVHQSLQTFNFYKKFLTMPAMTKNDCKSLIHTQNLSNIYSKVCNKPSGVGKEHQLGRSLCAIGLKFFEKNQVKITNDSIEEYLLPLTTFMQVLVVGIENFVFKNNSLEFGLCMLYHLVLHDAFCLQDFQNKESAECVAIALQKYVNQVYEQDLHEKKIQELSKKHEQDQQEAQKEAQKLFKAKEESLESFFKKSNNALYLALYRKPAQQGILCLEFKSRLEQSQKSRLENVLNEEKKERNGFPKNVWQAIAVHDEELKKRSKLEQEQVSQYLIQFLLLKKQQLQEDLQKTRRALIKREKTEFVELEELALQDFGQNLQKQHNRKLLEKNQNLVASTCWAKWLAWNQRKQREYQVEQVCLANQRHMAGNMLTARIVRINDPYQQVVFNEEDGVDLVEVSIDQGLSASSASSQSEQNQTPLPRQNQNQASSIIPRYQHNPYDLSNPCVVYSLPDDDNH